MAVLVAVALGVLPVACHRGPPAHEGPIVLITIDALRADMVGALGGPPKVMPALSALARQADYAGRAISPSSWTVPSMAALFTGFQPWRAQSWANDRAVLDDRFVTLPESLKKVGYKTSAYRSNHWLEAQFGYAQGFDLFQYLKEGKRAVAGLEQLKGGREFVWIHILPPHAPYIRRDPLLDRLDEIPPAPAQAAGPRGLRRSGRAPAGGQGAALSGHVQAQRRLRRHHAESHAGGAEAQRPMGQNSPRRHLRSR
jgi:hypothetical protein